MSTHRTIHNAGLALSIAALAAPSALASTTPQSLVSPDAQDAAAQSAPASDPPQQSLVSPDAQDAAAGRTTPEVTVVKVPAVATEDRSDHGGGLQWTDAGIGAGGMLGLIVLAGGTVALVAHRPRHRSTATQ
jgi:hypothetical protein